MKCLATVALASTLLLAQDPQSPRPTFKSAVDLVPVDVSVVDRDGRPIPDLTASDFTLTIDGKPRRIAAVQFISLARHTEVAAPAPLEYSSNTNALGGRLIALVIDQGNISAGTGKLAIDAAQRFVGALNPADRVALYTIPGAGPRVDFTSNHVVVRKLLETVTGLATNSVGPHNIGVAEIFALQRNNERALQELYDRECPGFRTPEEVSICRAQLAAEARALAAEIRARTSDSLLGLRSLFERLADIPGPKTVVLLSEGIIVERGFSELTWVAPVASIGQISLYVLQLEPPSFDATNPRVSATRAADIDLAQQGLGYLTGLARGDVFRVTAGADFAFSRISRELSGYYLLSFAPAPADRDGRPHKIRVALPGRRDLLVRSRIEFIVDPARTRTTEDVVAETLRSPLLATEIGLKAAVYTFWDPAARKVRVMIAADIDRAAAPSGQVSLAYAIVAAKGTVAASDFESKLDTPLSAVGRQSYVAAAVIDPGVHTLKLAVVDETGRRGSVEHTFSASVPSVGQVRVGGPLLAARDNDTGPLRTSVDGVFSSGLVHAYLELFSDAPQQLANASVTIELAQRPDSPRPVETAVVRFQDAVPGEPRVGEATLTIALLPPGDYFLRTVLNVSGRKVGEFVRPLRIVPAPN